MSASSLRPLQEAAHAHLGRGLSEEEVQAFATYAELLAKWNGVYNLVGPQALTELYSRHFPEALALFPLLGPNDKMLDIGTGAGFPGMVLALVLGGQAEITLLDSGEKKCRFLRDLVFALRLAGVKVVNQRAEIHAAQMGACYSTIVMRAVAETTRAVELASPLLAAHGQVLLLKGADYRNELERWEQAPLSRVFHPVQVILPPQWREGVILRLRPVSRET